MALLLMLVVILVTANREITRSWKRLREEHDYFSSLMVLDRTLDNILSNTVPFTWRDDEKNAIPGFAGQPHSLQLTYLHPPNNLQDGAIRFVALSVEHDQLKALYQERPVLNSDNPVDTAKVSVLATNVHALECRYADLGEDKTIEWVDEWDAERLDTPLAIMLSVAWKDARQETWLRRTAGNDHYQRWGRWEPPKRTE